jgi:hypothetical protein
MLQNKRARLLAIGLKLAGALTPSSNSVRYPNLSCAIPFKLQILVTIRPNHLHCISSVSIALPKLFDANICPRGKYMASSMGV